MTAPTTRFDRDDWSRAEDALLIAGVCAGMTFRQIVARDLAHRSIRSLKSRLARLRRNRPVHLIPQARPGAADAAARTIMMQDAAAIAENSRRLLRAMLAHGLAHNPPGLPGMSAVGFLEACIEHRLIFRRDAVEIAAKHAA